MITKTKIKELLEQATILAHAKTNDEIAEYLANSGVLVPPVKVGDKVFYNYSTSTFGSLLTNGVPHEHPVTSVEYDGNWKIISYQPYDANARNMWGYWGKDVFATKEDAQKRLDETRDAAYGKETKKE